MNQIQVFIIINAIPILAFIIIWLKYLKSDQKTRAKKIWIITLAVFLFLETASSVLVHQVLFPAQVCAPVGGIKAEAMPTIFHDWFNVKNISFFKNCK